MNASEPRGQDRPRRRSWALGLFAGACLFTLLTIPGPAARVDAPSTPTAFRWNADDLFVALEHEFTRATAVPLLEAEAEVDRLDLQGRRMLGEARGALTPPAVLLDSLANLQFEMAVLGAAHPSLLPRLQGFLLEARVGLMRAAASWPRDRSTHEALYRVLFGGRMALDEALVQAGAGALPALLEVEEIPSATPSILVQGVRIHSGDVLLSRGGAPTSALIARGNDFPNSFSHAALVHVDPDTGEGTAVESLIERGGVTSTVEDYLASRKYRILVLRMAPEHPDLVGDPLLPHRAAEAMLRRVRAEHVPYDFAMAWDDPTSMFCSEVIFHAFAAQGVDLWGFRSSMTSPGLVRWLGALGVREFTSLVPSDLEYDPQLRAVVEWRDPASLMDYRLDNAILDVLLEEADRGADLGYPWALLAPARGLKLLSLGQSLVGLAPTIPEGMSAETALRVRALVEEIAPRLKEDLQARASSFRQERGFAPPYWELVSLAREALSADRSDLVPSLSPG